MATKYLLIGEVWGSSKMLFKEEGKELIKSTCFRNIACKCWTALFFKCKGSTIALSEGILALNGY
jgi:hypothetical protein